MMKKYAALFMVAVVILAGCTGDDPGSPTPPFDPPQDSVDKIMRAFQQAMEELDFDQYRHLLHPDYILDLQQETQTRFPDLGSTLDRDEDLGCMVRMFSGDELRDPQGNFVPGVIDISFAKIQLLDQWREVPLDNEIPGDYWAPYEFEFLVNRGQAYSQLSCKGRLEFFMTGRDTTRAGVDWTYYTISGIVDKTSIMKRSTESVTYGTLKAIFRTSPED